jgi:N-methylhydantoinase A
MDILQAAGGIVRIANEHMAQALRVISVERGMDPRDFTLVSFGGAGGLHVCALAESMGMTRALVPVHAGVLSALGMLVAPRERQMSRSVARLLGDVGDGEIRAGIDVLVAQGSAELAGEHVPPEAVTVTPSLDLRYRGQGFALNVALDKGRNGGRDALEAAFHDLHEERYGHRLDLPIELVTLRVGLRGPRPALPLEQRPVHSGPPAAPRHVQMNGIAAPVVVRAELAAGQSLPGPALVSEGTSTTFVAPGWCCSADRFGNLLLTAGD